MNAQSLLTEAIDFRDPDDVVRALAMGANPNFKTYTALADRQVSALERIWLEHFKNPLSKDLLIIKALIAGGSRLVDMHARQVFKAAVEYGDIELMRLMFDHGFDLFNDTSAAYTAHLEVLAFLVEEQGVDINQSFDRRGTPLHHAIKMQREDLVAYLLDHDANIEASDFEGNTPLLTACEYQAHGLIPLLLARGANPQTVNFLGNSVLHLVNDGSSAQLLLEAGAQAMCINHCGFAPLDCNNPQTVSALEAHQLNQATPQPAQAAIARRL